MGYRSEIVIAIDPTVYDNASVSVKEALKEIFDEPTLEEAERIVFSYDPIKWYESDPQIAIIENWLRSLDEAEYGLIELGEDYSDNRFEGEYWNYGLEFVRKVQFQ